MGHTVIRNGLFLLTSHFFPSPNGKRLQEVEREVYNNGDIVAGTLKKNLWAR